MRDKVAVLGVGECVKKSFIKEMKGFLEPGIEITEKCPQPTQINGKHSIPGTKGSTCKGTGVRKSLVYLSSSKQTLISRIEG